MEKITKEKDLKRKEQSVLNLLDAKDAQAIFAFNCVNIHFFVDDLNKSTTLHLVFDYIYVKRIRMRNWELANACNVSERTLFRLRHEILKSFNNCYENMHQNDFTF